MPVVEILMLRHGHRLTWTLDPTTGKYTSSHPFPTRLPADPPLASHGAWQAEETAIYLSQVLNDSARDDRLRIYSSLFYRCLETLRPTVEKIETNLELVLPLHVSNRLAVRGERGIGEWFGKAWFEQPTPATPTLLRSRFFPWLDARYESRITPHQHGEEIEELHHRVARALSRIIEDVDSEYASAGRQKENVTVLMCGHAAQIIASGRVLTGQVPDDMNEEDFKCFTCGVSRFSRRQDMLNNTGKTYDPANWRTSGGVAGGWNCVLNSYCGHLSQGEERGWHFHGDESFDSYGPDSAAGPITSDSSVRGQEKGVSSNYASRLGIKL